MGGFRAKDADRDRFVELIEAAYVDGQLGSQDRDLRVSQALTAASLDELEALTRDLQRPPGSPITAVEPVTTTTMPVRTPHRSRGSAAFVAVFVMIFLVALFILGAVGLAFLAPSGSEDSGSVESTEVFVESWPTAEEPTAAVQDTFELTARDVRAFVRDYEAQFATLESYGAVLHPTRVSVDVPVRGSRPRAESWSYDGAWRQDAPASGAIRPGGIVDLGALDVRALFANIPLAERTLDVPRGEVTHVSVRRNLEGTPTVNIYVENSFRESGYLMTTMSGEVLRRFPAS